jgi:predicted DNA-binding ribbon-helix-helix protein
MPSFRLSRLGECPRDKNSEGADMKSPIIKRSVVINGHKTSVSLEQPFWDIARALAGSEQITVSALLRRIDQERQHANLSSAVRVYVLEQMRAQAARAGEMHPAAPAPAYVPSLGAA